MTSEKYESFSLVPIDHSPYALRLIVRNPPINLINTTFLTELHTYLTALQSTTVGVAPKVLVISSADSEI